MNKAAMLHALRLARHIRDARLPYANTWTVEGNKPGCLGGYMCYDPEFKRLGLKLSKGKYIVPLWGPPGDEWMAECALANLLGLNETETMYLFGTLDHIRMIDETTTSDTAADIVLRLQRVMAGDFNERA